MLVGFLERSPGLDWCIPRAKSAGGSIEGIGIPFVNWVPLKKPAAWDPSEGREDLGSFRVNKGEDT